MKSENQYFNPTFDFKKDGIGAAIKEEADSLKESFDASSLEHREVLERLLSQITKVDFESKVYPEKLERDQLMMAKRKPGFTGEQDNRLQELEKKVFKILQKHQKVVIVEELQAVARRNKWGLCQNHGNVYIYNGCYWKRLDKGELETFLGNAAQKMGVKSIEAKECLFKRQLVEQFFSDATLSRPVPVNGQVLINFQNGTLEIKDGEQTFRPFQQSDFLTYQLPFDYNPKATAPKWVSFLNEVLPDLDSQKVLAEFLGYVFVSTKRLKAEKALLLHGSGANGKSVVFEVIQALLGGSENVSGYPLETLTSSERGSSQRANIADKLLNYGSEISSRLDPNMAKALISGEPVEARPLYQQPYMIEDYAKMMFNCNELPRDTEQTNAFFRRFLIIPFDVTIAEEKQDRQLAQKVISAELSGIFNWVMEGLNRLLDQNGFTDCEAARNQMEQYKLESDSVQMFLMEGGYEADPNSYVPLKKLYSDYRSFCIEDGFKPVSKKNFKKRLGNQRILIEGRENRVYIRCKAEEDYDEGLGF